jgi:uncharacterized protein YcbX
MSVPSIHSLIIYPIKSLGGINVSKISIEPPGLQYDRRFMLVDERNNLITQRTRQELTRFQLEFKQEGFEVMDQWTRKSKYLHFNPILGSTEEVQIWDDRVLATEVLEDWSAWFSEKLDQKVRLFQLSSSFSRIINPEYQTEKSKISSFADSLPILLCSKASFDHLDLLLDHPLDWRRFRPNIIVSNQTAFEEDTWLELSIGSSVKLFGAKLCARCQLINVDPFDGTIDSNILKTLSQVRKFGNKVYFGQQFVPISLGEIKVGDPITLHKIKDAIF